MEFCTECSWCIKCACACAWTLYTVHGMLQSELCPNRITIHQNEFKPDEKLWKTVILKVARDNKRTLNTHKMHWNNPVPCAVDFSRRKNMLAMFLARNLVVFDYLLNSYSLLCDDTRWLFIVYLFVHWLFSVHIQKIQKSFLISTKILTDTGKDYIKIVPHKKSVWLFNGRIVSVVSSDSSIFILLISAINLKTVKFHCFKLQETFMFILGTLSNWAFNIQNPLQFRLLSES